MALRVNRGGRLNGVGNTFYAFGKQKKEAFFYVSAMLNTLATALSINIYYIYKKISFNFSLAAIIAAIAVMVYLISDIAIMKTKGKKIKRRFIIHNAVWFNCMRRGMVY